MCGDVYVYDITTKYGVLWCRSVIFWLHGGCLVVGEWLGWVELCSVYMFFRVFQIILLETFALCFIITERSIEIGCFSNGTKFVGRNRVYWSSKIHPVCNISSGTESGRMVGLSCRDFNIHSFDYCVVGGDLAVASVVAREGWVGLNI